MFGAMVEAGIEPPRSPRPAVDAVRNDRFWVLPHPTTLDLARAAVAQDRGRPPARSSGSSGDAATAYSDTYGDVDRSSDPVEAAAWMDRVATYPGVAASKARSAELLAGCGRVLDLGCGVGNDVRALGRGAVGVDPSRTMLREARRRGGMFVLAEGQHLPFRRGCVRRRAGRPRPPARRRTPRR